MTSYKKNELQYVIKEEEKCGSVSLLKNDLSRILTLLRENIAEKFSTYLIRALALVRECAHTT